MPSTPSAEEGCCISGGSLRKPSPSDMASSCQPPRGHHELAGAKGAVTGSDDLGETVPTHRLAECEGIGIRFFAVVHAPAQIRIDGQVNIAQQLLPVAEDRYGGVDEGEIVGLGAPCGCRASRTWQFREFVIRVSSKKK
jgi:hypothetical protein